MKTPTPMATRRSTVVARVPAQERGRVRLNALLDATRDLLEEQDFNTIGVYDIAKRANVLPTSAYHFLPTPEAAFLALAKRYLVEQREFIERPFDRSKIQNWPDLFNLRSDRTVEFMNNNKAYRKLFLSGNSADIRRVDEDNISTVSSAFYDWLDQHVVMPYLPNPKLKFTSLIGIWDGIWAASYAEYGYIAPDYIHEARVAALAYCKTFLPDVLPLRPPPLD